MNKEILLKDFKEIPNHNGRYIMSIDGLIFDLKKRTFIKPKKNPKTPKVTVIHLNGGGRKTISYSIETLMIKMFGIDIKNPIYDYDGEVWKDIVGYEGEYQVSNYGRVKSLPRTITQAGYSRTVCGNLMSAKRNNGCGYINILLCKGEDGQESKYVHRLVAEHFVENYNEDMTINHKDFNKANNHISNLECVTQQENIIHLMENKNSHFITDDLKLQVAIMHSQEMSIDEMCEELNLQYPVVKQIINKYVTI